MKEGARTVRLEPTSSIILRRSSRLLAKAALAVECDGDQWRVYIVTGTPENGVDFHQAVQARSEAEAARLCEAFMSGGAWFNAAGEVMHDGEAVEPTPETEPAGGEPCRE